MRLNRELALVDFRQVFAEHHQPVNKHNFFIWQLLLVGTVVLFSLITLPQTGTGEESLYHSQTIIEQINQSRLRLGLTALQENPKLQEAAQAKAQDIFDKGYFAHTSPTGVEPWDFIKNTGLNYAFAGENLALNYSNAYELNSELLQSPSHRANLLSGLFTEVGVAVVEGEYLGQPAIVTVQMFARTAK